jgi:hypothetical protein
MIDKQLIKADGYRMMSIEEHVAALPGNYSDADRIAVANGKYTKMYSEDYRSDNNDICKVIKLLQI